MDKPAKFYITTPIYYVNAHPHIGHTYTTVVCDAIARRQRMMGMDTYFLTGTDEHGQKIERSATAAGCSPKEFVDKIAAEYRELWDRMKLSYDDFIRTTEPRHVRGVQALFTRLQERGYIYKGSYSGQYCVFDELYVDAVGPGAPCPECGRPTETVQEENYFFKLSAMEDRLLKLYAEQPDFIRPETRRNEVIAFVRSGLRDLSVSRTTFKWGIPVPGDPKHVIYVWLDALANYITAIGFGSDKQKEQKKVRALLAGRRAHDRQGDRALSLRVLAGISAGSGTAVAQVDHGARMAVVRREQDVEVARQHRAQRDHSRHARRRHAALFPVARNRLRQRWLVQLRCAGAALQRRSGERAGQSLQPHAEHDHALLRRRGSVSFDGEERTAPMTAIAELARADHPRFPCAVRAVPVFACAGDRVGAGLGGQQIHRRKRALDGGRKAGTRTRARGWHRALHLG